MSNNIPEGWQWAQSVIDDLNKANERIAELEALLRMSERNEQTEENTKRQVMNNYDNYRAQVQKTLDLALELLKVSVEVNGTHAEQKGIYKALEKLIRRHMPSANGYDDIPF